MPKTDIPKVLREIPLGEYHPSYEGKFARVWVNPNYQLVRQRMSNWQKKIQTLTAGAGQPAEGQTEEQALTTYLARLDEERRVEHEWMSVILSQGEDAEEHWSAAELEQAFQNSPNFVKWLTERANDLLNDQRTQEKKS